MAVAKLCMVTGMGRRNRGGEEQRTRTTRGRQMDSSTRNMVWGGREKILSSASSRAEAQSYVLRHHLKGLVKGLEAGCGLGGGEASGRGLGWEMQQSWK